MLNFEKFQLVLQLCTIFDFKIIFFNNEKQSLAKIWGGCSPPYPQPPVSTGLLYNSTELSVTVLTILTWKNLCFIELSAKIH